ncbi:MAG: thioesterase [Spirochaetia bacterium]|jgi:medium-chain acyl-[acyl-carrier-protein] hydrolase|nr:thioesterase [Spirochaetia bacterium]
MIHKDTFTVNSFQVDGKNKATPAVLFGMMQESASLYCLENNIGIDDLARNNLTWMLARQYVKFSCFPSWRSSVTVETWPRNKTGIRALRDYLVTDETGKEVARSVTNWMLIDTKTRRLCKIDDTIRNLTAVEKSVMADNFKIKIEKPSEVSGGEAGRHHDVFRVRASDFDINSHVNNICYIRWALDTLPLDFHKNNTLSEIYAEFIEEISSEIEVEASVLPLPYRETEGHSFYHELKNMESGHIVFRGHTSWNAGG